MIKPKPKQEIVQYFSEPDIKPIIKKRLEKSFNEGSAPTDFVDNL
jgi:hypothetical protein